jgi:hypothetical protein
MVSGSRRLDRMQQVDGLGWFRGEALMGKKINSELERRGEQRMG